MRSSEIAKETEMKLTDVARASLAELAGDYIMEAQGETFQQEFWGCSKYPACSGLRKIE